VLTRPDHWQRIDGFTDDPTGATADAGRAFLDACVRATAVASRHLVADASWLPPISHY